MNRLDYHRDYYQRTIERRRQIARESKKQRHWCRWLLMQFNVPLAIVFAPLKRKSHGE